LDDLAEKDPEKERLSGIGEEKSPYIKSEEDSDQINWQFRDYGDT